MAISLCRLDEVEDAVNINAKLNQTVKNKEEKIEGLESRLVDMERERSQEN